MTRVFQYTGKTAARTMAILHRFLESLDGSKVYDIEIKPHREKRSLDANAYCWVLCEKLAQVIGLTKEQVYRQHIKDVGVFRPVEINESAVETLCKSWALHGIGWLTERVDHGAKDGFVLVNLYYGSSAYNTKQMARLIDNLVEDCKACGVETLPPEKLEAMKEAWGK